MTFLDRLDLGLGSFDMGEFSFGHPEVVRTEGQSRTSRGLESEVLHLIEESQGGSSPKNPEAICDDRLKILLRQSEVVEGHVRVPEKIIEDDPAR